MTQLPLLVITPLGKLGTDHPEKVPDSKFPLEINSAALPEELPEKQIKAVSRIVKTNRVNVVRAGLKWNV